MQEHKLQFTIILIVYYYISVYYKLWHALGN